VGVRLHDRGRNTEDARRRDHRAADVPSRAEDGVGPSPSQNPQAGRRRERVEGEHAEEPKARTAGQALDPKRVELEPRGARQPLLDGVRPTGERDGRAVALKRLGDRERGQDVPGRPAGGDQEPWRSTLLHG
jgi:hypothetical protein